MQQLVCIAEHAELGRGADRAPPWILRRKLQVLGANLQELPERHEVADKFAAGEAERRVLHPVHEHPGREGDCEHLEQDAPIGKRLRRARGNIVTARRAETAEECSSGDDEGKGQPEQVEIERALDAHGRGDARESREDLR